MSTNSKDTTKKEENIPTFKQLLALKLMRQAQKLESSNTSFPRIKRAKDSVIQTVSDEASALTSVLSIYQAKRHAKKAARNPDYFYTLTEEMKKNNL